MKKIKIRVFQDGTIESKTENIVGEQCQSYARLIERLTGMTPVYIKDESEIAETEETIFQRNEIKITNM